MELKEIQPDKALYVVPDRKKSETIDNVFKLKVEESESSPELEEKQYIAIWNGVAVYDEKVLRDMIVGEYGKTYSLQVQQEYKHMLELAKDIQNDNKWVKFKLWLYQLFQSLLRLVRRGS